MRNLEKDYFTFIDRCRNDGEASSVIPFSKFCEDETSDLLEILLDCITHLKPSEQIMVLAEVIPGDENIAVSNAVRDRVSEWDYDELEKLNEFIEHV